MMAYKALAIYAAFVLIAALIISFVLPFCAYRLQGDFCVVMNTAYARMTILVLLAMFVSAPCAYYCLR